MKQRHFVCIPFWDGVEGTPISVYNVSLKAAQAEMDRDFPEIVESVLFEYKPMSDEPTDRD